MNTLIRVEGPKGGGMYREKAYGDEFNMFMYGRDQHPPPRTDYLLIENAPLLFRENEDYFFEEFRFEFIAHEYVFGFVNFKQFRAWLSNDDVLAELALYGNKIVIMQGKVYEGSTQGIIHKPTAKVLRTLSIEEFLAENGLPDLI